MKCVLVGYCDNGYRVYNPSTQKVFSARDIMFGMEVQSENLLKNNKKETIDNEINEVQNDIILCIRNNKSVLTDANRGETSNVSESVASDNEQNNTLTNTDLENDEEDLNGNVSNANDDRR